MGDVCRLSWQPSEKRAIRRFSPSGAWGEIVCLSGLSVWMMRAVITRVRLCVCARRVRVCVPVLTATWQRALSGVQKGRILRHVAFKNCSLAQTASQIFSVEAAALTAWITLSSVWHNRRWSRLIEYHVCVCACLCIPWAVAGALPVHDSSSTGSRAVRPLRPGWPLAIHSPGTMFAELDALTSTTPLKRPNRDWRLRKRRQAGKAFLSASLGNTSFLSFQHAWTHKCFHYSQHTHTQACNTPQPIQVKHWTAQITASPSPASSFNIGRG